MNAFEPVQAAQLRRAAARQKDGTLRAFAEAAARTAAAAALGAGITAGAWQAWRWATTSEAFALREIRVTGAAHATQAELLER